MNVQRAHIQEAEVRHLLLKSVTLMGTCTIYYRFVIDNTVACAASQLAGLDVTSGGVDDNQI